MTGEMNPYNKSKDDWINEILSTIERIING